MTMLVGIGGGSGSGKTTLVKQLFAACQDLNPIVVEQDHYYFDLSHMDDRERGLRNYDIPEAIDLKLISEHLHHLKSGRAVDRPCYDFVTHTRVGTERLEAKGRLIFFDGIHAFSNQSLYAQFDLGVYVEAADDVRLSRRVLRDVRDRGRTMESVVAQYLGSVAPMHRIHVQPTRPLADLVVDWNEPNPRTLKQLVRLIRGLYQ